jgi:hypothetical protein
MGFRRPSLWADPRIDTALPPAEGRAAAGEVPDEDDGDEDRPGIEPDAQGFPVRPGRVAVEERGGDDDDVADEGEDSVLRVGDGEGIEAEHEGEGRKQDEDGEGYETVPGFHTVTPWAPNS